MQAVFVQGRDGVGAVGQHGTLVDRAFVGDFSSVNRRRLVQQSDPLKAAGVAAGAVVGAAAAASVYHPYAPVACGYYPYPPCY